MEDKGLSDPRPRRLRHTKAGLDLRGSTVGWGLGVRAVGAKNTRQPLVSEATYTSHVQYLLVNLGGLDSEGVSLRLTAVPCVLHYSGSTSPMSQLVVNDS